MSPPESIDFEPHFIPFFMKNKENRFIWKYTIDNLLTLDKNTLDQCKPYFGYESLKNIIKYTSALQDSDIFIQNKSGGLGLAISRLIAKAFNGDCGVEYDDSKKIVRFWFVIEYKTSMNQIDL